MSVDYYSYAVIGCKIPGSKMYKSVKKYHAKHSVPDGAAYCPMCGEPAFQTVREPIFDEGKAEIDGLRILWGTDMNEVYIGLIIDEYESIDPEDTEDFEDLVLSIYHRLRFALLPHDIWEDTFGIHSVLYCSY